MKFCFGIDATKRLYELAGKLPPDAWETLIRPAKHEVKLFFYSDPLISGGLAY